MNEEAVNIPEVSVDAELTPAPAVESAATKAKRARHSAAQKRYVQNRNEAKHPKNYVYDSAIEPTKAEALKILEARGIRHQQVQRTVYRLMLQTAEEHGICPNRFYFHNGVIKTLASYEAKSPQILDAIADEPVTGELISRPELFAIYDASFGPNQVDKTFEEFVVLRRICKTDAYQLGLLLGKDFEQCQRNWAEFLPRFNPDTLVPNYTQKQMRLWLDSISDVKDYLLLASRNSMKSSFALVWLLTLHLTCPDARGLLVSETKKLSAGFVRAYRSYWELKPHSDSMLHKLFPEYCIEPGTGSTLSFESPMSHLDLIQSSAEATSMESVVAGGRAEVLIFDDPISNLSCGTRDQREKSVASFDLLQKLREVLGSFSITIGTPWYDDGNGDADLYGVLLSRNEEDGNHSLAFRIDPVASLKRHAQHKLTPELLPSLVEQDVESYLLPVRMPWRFIKKEIANNPAFALSQNFCIFPKPEDADLRVTFDEDELRNHTKPFGHFSQSPLLATVLSIDTAWSVSRFADRSALVTTQFRKHNGKNVAVVTEVVADRWKTSVLAVKICEAIERNRPDRVLIEKSGDYENLAEQIRNTARYRGLVIPHMYWQTPTGIGRTAARIKMARIKALEPRLAAGQLYFISASAWNDLIIDEFLRFDGITKSNSHRKDDIIDSLGLAVGTYFPRDENDPEEKKSQEQERNEELAAQAARLRGQYDQMFGNHNFQSKQEEPTPSPQPQPDSRGANPDSVFGGNGLSIYRRRT